MRVGLRSVIESRRDVPRDGWNWIEKGQPWPHPDTLGRKSGRRTSCVCPVSLLTWSSDCGDSARLSRYHACAYSGAICSEANRAGRWISIPGVTGSRDSSGRSPRRRGATWPSLSLRLASSEYANYAPPKESPGIPVLWSVGALSSSAAAESVIKRIPDALPVPAPASRGSPIRYQLLVCERVPHSQTRAFIATLHFAECLLR